VFGKYNHSQTDEHSDKQEMKSLKVARYDRLLEIKTVTSTPVCTCS